MTPRSAALAATLIATLATLAPAQNPMPAAAPGPTAGPEATRGLPVKWVRESEEYATLFRQVYRVATRAVETGARQVPAGRWAVVLDVDETSLDNSLYELERAAYGQPFAAATWDPWLVRRAAGAVPGVVDFIAAVRRLGGHVAWITDHPPGSLEDTRATLRSAGLWNDDDRLCLLDTAQYTKAARRAEVLSGSGRCAWTGQAMTVLAYFGDQMGDFPQTGESDPDAGSDAAFGVRFFILANPMYGRWTTRVTRRDR